MFNSVFILIFYIEIHIEGATQHMTFIERFSRFELERVEHGQAELTNI